jgi:hypothetical protein
VNVTFSSLAVGDSCARAPREVARKPTTATVVTKAASFNERAMRASLKRV